MRARSHWFLAVLVLLTAAGPAAAQHGSLSWDGTGPQPCLECHRSEAIAVHGSGHFQWEGAAPYSNRGVPPSQGKNAGALNSYCVNILGNFPGSCGTCHVGRGAAPEAAWNEAQLQDIDCLVCHQENYKRVKVSGKFVFDPSSGITATQAVRTVHEPTRKACLQCHAKAGGGDAYKRGDLALAHTATTDERFDVHMATTGANLRCQDCHTTSSHRIAGRGSDLRQTDLDTPVACTRCHENQHGDSAIGRHVTRVACQTCHVGARSARNAADTAATEATEVHRDWTRPEWKSAVSQYHPTATLKNDIKPVYRFWNGYSANYTLGDRITADAATGTYTTSKPVGGINDQSPIAKLYPFKYKTAYQPYATTQKLLVPLDTRVYFGTGSLTDATRAGLGNLGYSPDEAWSMVTSDTYQLLTHEIIDHDSALQCAQCHGSNATQMSLKTMGYALKAPESSVCTQCHKARRNPGWQNVHDSHVSSKRYDCSFCHTFTRPERNLRTTK